MKKNTTTRSGDIKIPEYNFNTIEEKILEELAKLQKQLEKIDKKINEINRQNK
jgi:deoxyhypusine synthase